MDKAVKKWSEGVLEHILENHLVPFEFGVLEDSGEVVKLESSRKKVSYAVQFGAPGSGAEAYAVPQHERLDYHHPISGGPKYLEIPYLQKAATFERDVLTDLRVEEEDLR